MSVFYRDMGFVTLNVLLDIVQIQGLGMLLFRIVNHRDGDIVKYVFNSALVHIFLYFTYFIPTVNLALHQPTWEQHPWPDKIRDFGSENAVDGMYTDRGAKGGQCTISDDGEINTTWGVDLGRVVSISHIEIYYRTKYDCVYLLKLNLINT